MTLDPREVADALGGKRVLSVRSHPLSGVIIDLGEWRRRRKPVKNGALTEQERNFEGSHSLFIQTELKIRANSALLVNGRRPEGDEVWGLLDQLVGYTLLEAKFVNPILALELSFDNGFYLYADTADSAVGARCYSIAVDGLYWTVYAGGRVEESPRAITDSSE
jgi:hypothetical protein